MRAFSQMHPGSFAALDRRAVRGPCAQSFASVPDVTSVEWPSGDAQRNQLMIARPNYFAHPTAVIDLPCEIGEGTKIWHFSHVCAGVKIGMRCIFGQNTMVADGVVIGSNVKVQNNVAIYTG